MMQTHPSFLVAPLMLLQVALGPSPTASPKTQESPTPRRITRGPGGEFEPQWSPDGSMLSYGSGEMGGQNVAVMNLKTGKETLLTTGLGFVHATTWSPNGRQLAFVTGSETENGFVSHIYIVDLGSKLVRQLTHAESIDATPSWSPDGKSIVFPSERSGVFNLWIKPVDGGAATMVTDDPADDHGPEWSPDGKRIAFHSTRSGTSSIWILGVGDGSLTQVTDDQGNDQYPDWSPDGRFVAFHSDRSGNQEIWVQDLVTGEATQVTFNPAMDIRPSWSPDGRKIAFSSDREGSMDVWVIDAPVQAGSPVGSEEGCTTRRSARLGIAYAASSAPSDPPASRSAPSACGSPTILRPAASG